jgi:predicted nucleic acid-binding protein
MILVDAGFLYALLDKDDAWHARAVAASGQVKEKWITTWPVLTEATHLIVRWLGVEPATALMQDIADGDIALRDIAPESCRDFRAYRWKSRKPFQNLLA